MKEFNIVLAGVGGQGTLLAAEILGTAALNDGLNVRVSEIHGMAQRGGAVTSNVRIGEDVAAPTIMEGQADVLVGFEPIETLRNLKSASEKTLVVISDEKVFPPELTSKSLPYPSMEEIFDKIKMFTTSIITVKTERLSKEAGSILARNAVLLGALAGTGRVPIKTDSLLDALRKLVPTNNMDTNVKAFKLGYAYVKGEAKAL